MQEMEIPFETETVRTVVMLECATVLKAMLVILEDSQPQFTAQLQSIL